MKTIEEILNQTPVYLNDWENKIDVISDFEDIHMKSKHYYAEESPYPNVSEWKRRKVAMGYAIKQYADVNILFASYGCASYSGDAWVLFSQDNKLYEVRGSHCSCYGLENQWEPEEVLLKELENRLTKGTFGEDDWSDNNFKTELCEFLGVDYQLNMEKDF